MTLFRTDASLAERRLAHAIASTTRVRGTALAVVAFALGACAYPLEAQATPPAIPPGGTPVTAPAGTAAPQLAPYRAPAIALVQPLPGGSVTQDRAALVIRFTQGEPDDPLDVSSFALTVDGEERTKEFQLTATQAWGTLGASDPAKRLTVGTHQVAVRICSSRNACAMAEGSVAVLPAMGEAPATASRKKNVLGAVLDFGRRLLLPR